MARAIGRSRNLGKGSNAEQEAEVVPATIVVHLIDAKMSAEQVADKGEDCGYSVPETIPEAVNFASGLQRGVGHRIGGSAGGEEHGGEHEDSDNHEQFLIVHSFLLEMKD